MWWGVSVHFRSLFHYSMHGMGHINTLSYGFFLCIRYRMGQLSTFSCGKCYIMYRMGEMSTFSYGFSLNNVWNGLMSTFSLGFYWVRFENMGFWEMGWCASM